MSETSDRERAEEALTVAGFECIRKYRTGYSFWARQGEAPAHVTLQRWEYGTVDVPISDLPALLTGYTPDAVERIKALEPHPLDEDIPDDDKEAAYEKGYADAITDALAALRAQQGHTAAQLLTGGALVAMMFLPFALHGWALAWFTGLCAAYLLAWAVRPLWGRVRRWLACLWRHQLEPVYGPVEIQEGVWGVVLIEDGTPQYRQRTIEWEPVIGRRCTRCGAYREER